MSSTQRHSRGGARGEGGSSGWVGQPAAIYCRISKARDEDQTGVDRQERLCREVADRLGLVIAPGAVLVDNNRSAWQRNRSRPGWNALLEAIRAGRVGHVIVYHPDRLMRQPATDSLTHAPAHTAHPRTRQPPHAMGAPDLAKPSTPRPAHSPQQLLTRS
jgi:hypothetical protein